MTERATQYLFGPVPSRRLGRSLGVDLTPFKTCSFDCIFCQLGRTTRKTVTRRDYVPVDAVIAELEAWLRSGQRADIITLAGSGEPTLHASFGRVIEFARRATRIPVALLTNGSLLGDPDVRAQAARANVVKVSLSAWDQASLERINRPHRSIGFRRLLEGQRRFRGEFKGALWMEVFLVQGINTAPGRVSAIAELARSIGPDKVQLNTAVRPPCEATVRALTQARMNALARRFDPPAEVIADYRRAADAAVRATEADVLELIARRPCTLDQVSRAFGLHRNEVSKYLGALTRTGRARARRRRGELYYAGAPGGRIPHADV